MVFEKLGGEFFIEFVFDVGESNGVMEFEFLVEVEKFLDYLCGLFDMFIVYMIIEIIKWLNWDINKGDGEYYCLFNLFFEMG